jgi:hypothetical protein
MNNTLTEEQLDKYIEPYFDMRFKDTQLYSALIDGISNEWFGFWKDGEHILGYPANNDEYWYCSGPYFSNGIFLFSLEPKEYYEAMRRYVNKNYPKLRIKKIF